MSWLRTDARPVLAAALAGYAALFAVGLHVRGPRAALVLALLATAGFAGLILLPRRCAMSARGSAAAIVAGGGALQLVAITAGPTTSDDVYRYVWDARVQLHGIDPYSFAPQAPQLAGLRDSLLFGAHSACTYAIPGSCTAINRPDVHTVYPPVAQALFDVVGLASSEHGGARPFQIAAAIGCVLVTALLLAILRRRSAALWPAAIWAWSPIVVVEYGNNAHIDWAAVALSLLAIMLARRGRDAAAGAALGAAVVTKLYPVLLLPALARRRPLLVLGAAAGLGALSYVPHVVAAGAKVIGFLPGYLQEEGYQSGARLQLVGKVFPHPLDSVAGAAILLVVAWWVWRRADPTAPERAATTMLGAAFLVTTPHYGWYAGLFVALIVVSGAYHWLPVAFAPTFVYLLAIDSSDAGFFGSTTAYLLAALLTFVLWRRAGWSAVRRHLFAARASGADAGPAGRSHRVGRPRPVSRRGGAPSG